MPLSLSVAARGSALSKVQVREVLIEIQRIRPDVEFAPIWVETVGDRDQVTSLKTLEKTDFFTKEIDALQLEGKCRIAVHAAKDLPDPLPEGLVLAALTVGVDPSDVLVLREGKSLEELPEGAKIGTSSERREEVIRELGKNVSFVDIRGSILQRLDLLDTGAVDGVVMAEAALIRLELQARNRVRLQGPTAPFQGQLAVIVRAEDKEMLNLFSRIDTRIKTLYLGTDITHFSRNGEVIHCPLIQIMPRSPKELQIQSAFEDLEEYTHFIFTSKHGVRIFFDHLATFGRTYESLLGKQIFAVGKVTAHALETRGLFVRSTPEEETQEGIIELLRMENLEDAYVFLPGSSISRPQLLHFLTDRGVRHQACAIYDTLPEQPVALPDLEAVDEIIFTSPSTVRAFFQIFSQLPQGKRLGVYGPVTENALKFYLKEEMEIFYV